MNNAWDEGNTLKAIRVDGNGKSPKARKLARIYKLLSEFGENLPKQADAEAYRMVMENLDTLWKSISGKSSSDLKKGIMRTEDGDYPESGDFITCSFNYDWTHPNYIPGTPDHTTREYQAMVGLSAYKETDRSWPNPEGKYSKDEDLSNYYSIAYCHNGKVYIYRYFPEQDYVVGTKIIDVKDIVKWKLDDEKALASVPEEALEEVRERTLRY